MRCLSLYVLLAVIFVAFAGTLQSFFVQDDFWLLESINHEWPNWYMLWGQRLSYLRPVSTYWWPLLLYNIFGLNPVAWHVMMMGVFLGTCYLLYHYLLDIAGSHLGALIGMGVYGLSKIHAWTLSWVAGSCDILGMFFVILGLYFYRQKSWWCIPALMLAFFCKEVFGIVLLCLILASLVSYREDWKFVVVGIFAGLGCLGLRYYATMTHPHLSGVTALDLVSPFTIERATWIWSKAIYAVVPAWNEYEWVWYCALIVGVLWSYLDNWKPLTFAVLLFAFNGILFAIIRWPIEMQLYYTHFCILAIAISVAVLISRVKDRGIVLIVIMLAIPYAWLSVSDSQVRIEQRGVPALYESYYSETIYNQARSDIGDGATTVVVNVSNGVVSNAIGHGRMMEIYFPDIEVEYTGECGGDVIAGLRLEKHVPITEEL